MSAAVVDKTEVDLCPVCAASGWEACVEEDGQYVLDHWGRPAEWVNKQGQEAATRTAAA